MAKKELGMIKKALALNDEIVIPKATREQACLTQLVCRILVCTVKE